MNPPPVTLDDFANTFNCKNPNYQAAIRIFFTNFYQDNIDINMIDDSGMTLLHHLAAKNNLSRDLGSIAYDLLRHGADVNVLDNSGRAPLHLAALNGHFRLVELLIHFKADLSIKDHNSDTPLHLSAKAGGARNPQIHSCPGHFATLATLLIASYNQNPSILQTRNNRKKLFNDLFTETIQILIFNRFNALKKIKTSRIERNQVDSIIRSSKNVDTLCALIVLNDHASVIKRFEADIITMTKLLHVPLLYISPQILKLLKIPSVPDCKSVLSRFFNFYSSPASFKALPKFNSDYFIEINNGFSIFNHMCSVYDSKIIEKAIINWGEAAILQLRPNLICSNVESLYRFHPELAQKYLPYMTFTLKDSEKLLENCPICKNTSNSNGDKWIKLRCKHQFHEDCLSEWLPHQNTCPMCRRALHFTIKLEK